MKRCILLVALVAVVAAVFATVASPASAVTRWVNDDDPNGGMYTPAGTSCDNPVYHADPGRGERLAAR